MSDILGDPLSRHIRITRDRIPGLKKLGILTVGDLLYHFPARYLDQSIIAPLNSITDGVHATISGRILSIEAKESFKTKQKFVEARIEDVNGDVCICIWFNQLFIAKVLKQGSIVTVTGTATIRKGVTTLVNPTYDERDTLPIDYGNSLFNNNDSKQATLGEAIYPESQGVSSLFLRHAIRNILKIIHDNSINLLDPIPEYIRDELKLPHINKAIHWIHAPASQNQMSSARKRFSFEYIFKIQVAQQSIRASIAREGTDALTIHQTEFTKLLGTLPFELTQGQKNVIHDIRIDMERPIPMQRLLEGDVGSGKTAIASLAAGIAISNHARMGKSKHSTVQVAYMAPTEVLANQLFESFITFFKSTKTPIVLLTGKTCKKFPSKSNPNTWTTLSKAQAKKWIANGEIQIVVGTHALISRGVEWEHLGLVIIDEQHRFGTNQRAKLAQKDGHMPHYLSMSATPMPRTLALTLYGDLDISVLDEVPPGRKPVITEAVTHTKREQTYAHIRSLLEAGQQCYVICPRVDSSNDEEVDGAAQKKSAATEAAYLQQNVFTDYKIGIMHGKLGKMEKEKVMQEFAEGKYRILVSTTVVEVGVNVPNATVIIIEGCERFGLSQLHQLRGRVMRSSVQPYCYLFMEGKSEKSVERIKRFISAKNGFELAELDLASRGAGDLLGAKQWGITDIGMEAIQNAKLVEKAQQLARALIATDPFLNSHPELQEYVSQYDRAPHLE
jgi:ATP-dependent DNA helicase RecG